jgi:hypothetical protein
MYGSLATGKVHVRACKEAIMERALSPSVPGRWELGYIIIPNSVIKLDEEAGRPIRHHNTNLPRCTAKQLSASLRAAIKPSPREKASNEDTQLYDADGWVSSWCLAREAFGLFASPDWKKLRQI